AGRIGSFGRRQLNIDEHDIRSGVIDDGDRLGGGRDISHDLDVRFAIEDLTDAESEDGTGLDYDEADGFVGKGTGRPGGSGQGNNLRRWGASAFGHARPPNHVAHDPKGLWRRGSFVRGPDVRGTAARL